MFITFKNNAMLDKQDLAPFGKVIEGMDIVDALYDGHGDDPDQGQIQAKGNQYLRKEFPKLSYIRRARLLSQMPSTEDSFKESARSLRRIRMRCEPPPFDVR